MKKISWFHSIRWRLVASYVLLTLLTVSLVGVLAVSLVKRHVEKQETSYLTANAEAVAQQALPLIWPVQREAALKNLARTSSFLGNVRVRILDDRQQTIADSGPRPEADQLLLMGPAGGFGPGPDSDQIVSLMILPDLENGRIFMTEGDQKTIVLPGIDQPAGWVTIVRRQDGIWGHRLFFGRSEHKLFPPGTDFSETGPLELRPEVSSPVSEPVDELQPRSQQVVTVPIGDENQTLGYVELSYGPNFGAEALATTRRAFLWAAGGATGLALLVGLVVSRSLTAPLRSLAAAADRMSSGDLSVRAPVHQEQGEIGHLALQFNQMAERLEASFAELAAERDTLRRFIADASHELRTPITTLKNFNELLQGPAADDPVAQQEFLSESATQLKRLEWITQNLLNLSRQAAGLTALDLTHNDVEELLQTAFASVKTPAQDKGIDLAVKAPKTPVSIQCDRTRLEMALANLLDNALKFTPSGGRVELGATVHHSSDNAADQFVQIWVQDSGPGIDPADLPHLFERFYRGRNAREPEGSGLGLAIVHSIV